VSLDAMLSLPVVRGYACGTPMDNAVALTIGDGAADEICRRLMELISDAEGATAVAHSDIRCQCEGAV